MIKQSNRLWTVTLILGWLFDFLFWENSLGINFAIFTTLCLWGGVWLLIQYDLRPAKNSLWLLLLFVFFAAVTFVRQEPITLLLGLVFSVFSVIVFASTYTGGKWIRYGLLDYADKFMLFVVRIISRALPFYYQSRREPHEQGELLTAQKIKSILRGILIALPIIVILANLLASADVVFDQKLVDFIDSFDLEDWPEYLWRTFVGLIVAYLLVGAYLHMESKNDERLLGDEKPIVKRFLGFTETSIVLGSVAILFLTFVIVQFQYFFGGEVNIGVEGYSYSVYARRGFSEMNMVAFISLVIIVILSNVSLRATGKQGKIFSALVAGVVVQVMIILVSSYQRLELAISWHGFSRFRLYPKVFLVWIGLLLLVVMLLEIKRMERYFTLAAVLASFGFAATLAIVNVDAAIVRHNVTRVSAGKHINYEHLAKLSTDAIPALVEEFRNPKIAGYVTDRLGAVLLCYIHADLALQPKTDDWQAFNWSQWRAHDALSYIDGELEDYRVNDKNWPIKINTPAGVRHVCPG